MVKSNQTTIRLNDADNVVVARADILPGVEIGEEGVTARETIPAGHKVAVSPIKSDAPVRKYNQIIGFAAVGIEPGSHVHSHNCDFRAFERDHAFCADAKPTDFVAEDERATFNGFVRENGAVGTRNYIGVLTSVNCSATVARYIAEAFPREELAQYENVDGVVSFVHSTGCGMASDGEGFANLQRVLWGFARHPNLAGVLLVGLGCEVNQVDFLLDAYGLKHGPAFQTMTIQATGGARKTVERGVDMIRAMLPAANQAVRTPVSASHLTLALQCGGSDAYSGITANPSLGAAADLLVRHGGSAILSETPEIYGAEHLLTRRAETESVGRKLLERIEWWENYTRINNGSMDNNPSPGNKEGGLTTILEKSLGAAAKGGTTNLTGVYKYAERISSKGFAFMDSPGYDPCSITGQVAAGANVVCFTTGRGSVYGCKPAPSLKLATNTSLYRHMEEDMDVNCGLVVDGDASIEDMGGMIFDQILRTASGERTRSELFGFGDDEFIPWQIGAVM